MVEDEEVQQMLKKKAAEIRARGGIPQPSVAKPMTDLDAIARTALKNSQDIRALGQNFQQFADQTEQAVLSTQRAIQGLARPDIVLQPVVDQWHESKFSHLIILIREGIRIAVVGQLMKERSDEDLLVVDSDQGIISINHKDVLMVYEKEEGKVYGRQISRDSEVADESAEESSEGPKDPSVETEKS